MEINQTGATGVGAAQLYNKAQTTNSPEEKQETGKTDRLANAYQVELSKEAQEVEQDKNSQEARMSNPQPGEVQENPESNNTQQKIDTFA